MRGYLHTLEINKRGEYYADYKQLEGSKDEITFTRIETRLREFTKTE